MARRRRDQLRPAEVTATKAVGRLAELWGLRRNIGRTWAVLFLTGRPMTAAELRRALGLSTGSVSMTLKDLLRLGVIRQVWSPGERRKLYVAEVDVWRAISRVLRTRELVELDRAVDQMERALSDLRDEIDGTSMGSERRTLETRVARIEGLLDLLRMLSSLLRVLTMTARLDATTLASFRLGGEELVDVENGPSPRGARTPPP